MKKTLLSLLGPVMLAGVATAPAFAQAAAPAPATTPQAATSAAPQAAPAPAPAAQRRSATPPMWVVKDDDTTIYLLGTVHVLPAGIDWMQGAVKRAYDESDEVVLEMIEPEPTAMQQTVMARGINPPGTTLTSKLPEDKRAAFAAMLQSYNMPPTALDPLQPWLAAMTVATLPLARMGFDPNNGVEKVLTTAATSDGKTMGELEGFEAQIDLLAGMPEEQQIEFLVSGIDQMDEVEGIFNGMVDSWAAGRPDQLAEIMNDSLEDYPELEAALLTNRNTRWAEWVDNRLDRPGTVLVAVGAGHLAGEGSLQDALEARDITAVRVVR